MEIIYWKKSPTWATLGDRVKVKPGYARNFLIPKGKATAATTANLARFEARRAELERIAAERWPSHTPAPRNWPN
jgi:large subunit ribosomal protein L9